MKEIHIGALDEDIITYVLQFLDSDKTRATMACVCKTWQTCVRKLWHKVHLCFDSEKSLKTQLIWLSHELRDRPLYLTSLELHSSNANTHSSVIRLYRMHCIADPTDLIALIAACSEWAGTAIRES